MKNRRGYKDWSCPNAHRRANSGVDFEIGFKNHQKQTLNKTFTSVGTIGFYGACLADEAARR